MCSCVAGVGWVGVSCWCVGLVCGAGVLLVLCVGTWLVVPGCRGAS